MSNEWYTPALYIEAARSVMGGIDLDPASCEMANRAVKATRYYTQSENGLAQPWHALIWLNPPFSEQGKWCKKLLREYERGAISHAVFQGLWRYPICFADHQVIFNRPGASPYHIYHGVCFVYLGPNEARFIEVFSKFGTVVQRVSPATVQPCNLELWSAS